MLSPVRRTMFLCLLLGTACQQAPEPQDGSSSGGNTTDGTDGQPPGDPVFECDPVGQDCPDIGDRCTPVLSDGARNLYTCVPDPGGLELFDTCTVDSKNGVDGCAAGLVCLGDPGAAGTCVELCLTDLHCEAGPCIKDPFDLVPYCALECDPFVPLCMGSVQCRREQDRFACKFPEPGDEGFVLDPCDPGTDAGCGSGVVCIQGPLVPGCESGGCCSPVCDLDDVDAAAECASVLGSPAATCVALFDPPAPGFGGYGACLVPA